jgi:hypothetical protein
MCEEREGIGLKLLRGLPSERSQQANADVRRSSGVVRWPPYLISI